MHSHDDHDNRLHPLFESRVDADPSAIAVRWGRHAVSYLELEIGANRLARHLRALGAGPGARVALVLPRSIDAYAALLAILKAGAAYVPIDPDTPAERVTYILEDCDALAVVTTEERARSLEFRGAVVRVDADSEAIARQPRARLGRDEVAVGPRDLCYIIYTSGSTGRPKGVMVEHRSAAHLVKAEAEIFGVRPDDRVYQGFSLAFDASVEELWLAFNSGATLVPATPQMARSGPELSHWLEAAHVTVLSCVPTLLAMLNEDIWTLRLLILGGESCAGSLLERWALPTRRIVNTYGPTEATVIATYADWSPGRPVTIGRPVPGYRVLVLDESLRTVPPGGSGEICIGGPGVARGYVKLRDETASRFVADPFVTSGHAEDARLYRTGDLGRFDADGNLEFLGRADSQVKLRGYRIELAEIESVLMEAEGVQAAACAVHEPAPGLRQLVGYVVNHHAAPTDTDRVRHWLRSRLPEYMVPAVLERVEDLPRLASGKLDRASLPAPRAPANGARRRRAPRSRRERRIHDVWQSLFHPLPVGIDDDFFLDLGGHSLLAARAVTELRKDPRFSRLSVVDLYEHPTIEALATALDADQPTPTQSSATPTAKPSTPPPGAASRQVAARAGWIQAAGLYLVFGLQAIQWVAPYLTFFMARARGMAIGPAIGWAALVAVTIFPAFALAGVCLKWLLLGRIRPGSHPLWGGYHLRWWLAHRLIESVHLDQLAGTPMLPWFF